MLKIIKVADYKKMPWKNGQGFTLEVARQAALDPSDFDWRLSIADVKNAGPFSFFPNKYRILGVLEGQGLILKLNHPNHHLAHDTQTQRIGLGEFFAFSGDIEVYADLIATQIRDYNLIYDPRKFAARVQAVNSLSLQNWHSQADHVLILNLNGVLNTQLGLQQTSLDEFETLHWHNDQAAAVQISLEALQGINCYILELFQR